MDIEAIKEQAMDNLYDYVEANYDGMPLLESLMVSIGKEQGGLNCLSDKPTDEFKQMMIERFAQALMVNSALGINMQKLQELEQRIDEKLKKMAFVIDTLCEEKS